MLDRKGKNAGLGGEKFKKRNVDSEQKFNNFSDQSQCKRYVKSGSERNVRRVGDQLIK